MDVQPPFVIPRPEASSAVLPRAAESTLSSTCRLYLVPGVERAIPSADPDDERKEFVPKYDPDGQELPSWDHIWDFTGGPIRLVRTYRGTTEPSWAHEGDVRFLGEYPADLAAVRKMVARFFRTDRLPESALAAKLSQP